MCRPHGVVTSTHCFLPNLRKQGEQRTMRCHFLNPSFILFSFFFCFSNRCFSFPPPPALLEAVLIFNKIPPPPVSFGCFFFFFCFFFFLNHHWFSQWLRGSWDNGDHPLQSLTVSLSLSEVTGFDQDWLFKMNPLHP